MGTWGKRGFLAAATAALLALPAAAGAMPIVSEYSAGLTAYSGPMGMTAGPDGNVWFTENGNDTIAHVHPDGTFSEYAGVTGRYPRGIVTGPDGNLWFTETSTGTGAIGRITPSGTVTEFRTGLVMGNAQYITAGPDGNLWFTENGGTGAIGRITPSGTITEFTLGLTPNSSPWGITAGPDGNVWFTEKFNSGRIGRITPAGVITEFGGLPAGLPQEITSGPDGNLWFTAAANPGYIGRITPAGVVTAFTAGLTQGAGPQGITTGPDGALYFTEKNADALGRITTSGQITEYTGLLAANSAPFGIAAGPDGNIWFAENGNLGAVGRLRFGDAPSSDPPPATTPAEHEHASGAPVHPIVPVHGDDEDEDHAPPALGRRITVAPAGGTILVRLPGESAFRAVGASLSTPVGTEIDARRGTVVLTTALTGGRTQRASFRGARFRVRQNAKDAGMTDIILTERAPASARAGASAAATTRRKPPSLWAHDSHGRYRTYGHNSVATVRGTTWRTTELATGTLTQVSAGAVSVRDLHRHRSILVRAGHRYLARGKLRG